MKYPNFIKKGDNIGITAPSQGLTKEFDLLRLDNAKNNINKLGFNYIETQNVRTQNHGRSDTAQNRAEQFMELWKNNDVSAIIMATGGDFLMEILEFLDFEYIAKNNLKWIQGYSNITTLSFIFTTMLDIATIYGPNAKSFGMKNLYRNLNDSISLMEGNEITQESFDMCEGEQDTEDPLSEYLLIKPCNWKSLNGEYSINFSGRSIGGCLDDVITLFGTKYDYIKTYIDKYKTDGIIWFLEVYEMTSSQITRHLWQMKNAGYFENCKGILFGRPLFVREEYDINFRDAVYSALNDLEIPILYDVDIGHVAPQMPIVNGAILNVKFENNKGTIKTLFK